MTDETDRDFLYRQLDGLGCDHEYHEKKVEEVAEKTNEEKLEELKKEHPLVTNEKCFTLSWFPETIPSVLSEEEENVGLTHLRQTSLADGSQKEKT